jgi:hypothetical protein
MKNKEILQRCERELENSSSLEMLEVARKYSDLFLLKIARETEHVLKSGYIVKSIEKIFNEIYLRKRKHASYL